MDASPIIARFDGLPSSVGPVRDLVTQALEVHPRRDDAVLMASEVATNAVRHTASGTPGVGFEVVIRPVDSARIRIEVHDAGGDGVPMVCRRPGDSDGLDGRGLTIVNLLADRWGHGRAPGTGTIVWFEVAG
ncbi:ATP-binding protein [Streptosporangium sp. NPDC051023]|uniref:ATP-binding protein n=1 Tax=Streptosporangium sp. NPDC051023 TaxID=3155410 RepID=UPI00344F091C